MLHQRQTLIAVSDTTGQHPAGHDSHVQDLVDTGLRQLRELTQHRHEITGGISTIKRRIGGLRALFDIDLALAEQVSLMDRGDGWGATVGRTEPAV